MGLAFGGGDEGVKARRRDVNESGVVNKSRDLINKKRAWRVSSQNIDYFRSFW